MPWLYREDQTYALRRSFVEYDENGPIEAVPHIAVLTKKQSGNFPLEKTTVDNVVVTILNASNAEHQIPVGGGPPLTLFNGKLITFTSYGGKWYSET